MERLRNDPSLMDSMVNHSAERILRALIKMVGGLLMILAQDGWLALGGVVLHLLPTAWLAKQSSHVSAMYRVVQRDTMRFINATAAEALSNIQTVQSHVAEPYESKLYEQGMDGFMDISRHVLILESVMQFLTTVLQKINDNGFIVLGAWRVCAGATTVGQLIAFKSYYSNFASGFDELSGFSIKLSSFQIESAGYFDLLAMEEKDRLSASSESTMRQHPNFDGELVFENVGFSYPSRPTAKVLNCVNLVIPTGAIVALCGPSGSGKSTIVKLLQLFYSPSNGRITLGGVNLENVDKMQYRMQIAYVPQEPNLFDRYMFTARSYSASSPDLFDRTIAENIAYGLVLDDLNLQTTRLPFTVHTSEPLTKNDPKGDRNDLREAFNGFKHVSMDDVIEAAKLAGAHEFICSLPRSYNTRAGKGGTLLSGGQKQRIAIARACIRKPRIVLLDEPTSSLDPENEKLLQDTLAHAFSDCTQIIIAHRMSTIQTANLIYFIEGGKVVEHGTHEELLAKNDLDSPTRYKSFIHSQAVRGFDYGRRVAVSDSS
jgi:ABC-type multidrug transport system fused ATPase/permease subunit